MFIIGETIINSIFSWKAMTLRDLLDDNLWKIQVSIHKNLKLTDVFDSDDDDTCKSK